MTKHDGKKLESYLGFNFPWALAEELIKYELYEDGTGSIIYWASWEDSRLGPEPTAEQIDPSLKPPEPPPPDPTLVEGDFGFYELSTWEIWLRSTYPELIGDERVLMVPVSETVGNLRKWPAEFTRPSPEELIDQSLSGLDQLRYAKFFQARKTAAGILLASGMSYSDTMKAGSSLVNVHGAYLSSYFHAGAVLESEIMNFVKSILEDKVHPWLDWPAGEKLTIRDVIVQTLL